MRIGFFGGSFDPPHRGHLTVARTVAATFRLDRLLLAPTAQQPLKPGGAAASFQDRLAMVEILCRGEARFEPSALDAPRTHNEPNYTIDTLRHLRAEFAQYPEVYSIVGADSFLDLRRWRSPDLLLDIVNWIVVSRPGFALSALNKLGLSPEQRAHVYLLEGVTEPVSATEVRACLREGRDCSELVPYDVLSYIREHHLYGA
jgi:nicotinate-nucleotide adenylyltransferase